MQPQRTWHHLPRSKGILLDCRSLEEQKSDGTEESALILVFTPEMVHRTPATDDSKARLKPGEMSVLHQSEAEECSDTSTVQPAKDNLVLIQSTFCFRLRL